MDITQFILRLLAAIGAGALVGTERQWSNKSAGLKTNTLVALGACIYVLINIIVSRQMGNSDPTRIIGQIVTGIGFLGAGVIMHTGINVQGLTTAATIWCSAALGCVAGLGLYLETAVCTVAVLVVNIAFRKMDDIFNSKSRKKNGSDKPL